MGAPNINRCDSHDLAGSTVSRHYYLKGASSMSIYSNLQPYFYISEHIPTGKKYAGAKWGKNANKDTFLTEVGYTTSSKLVNDIISKEGLSAFHIVCILTEEDIGDVYAFETSFLRENDCGNSLEWLNQHNNENVHGYWYGSDRLDAVMINRYGKTNPMQIEEFREKAKNTRLEKYGDENFNNPAKNKNTRLVKYGNDTIRIKVGDVPPVNWTRGMHTGNKNEHSKNTKWYNNGTESKQFKLNCEIPVGWCMGMVKKVNKHEPV